MNRLYQKLLVAAVVATSLAASALPASAISFTTSYTAGGTWRTVYAQGFRPNVTPSPDPGHAPTDTVLLDRFQFFKGGTADTATNIQLAIVSNIFLDITPGQFTTNTSITPSFVGLSTNTIADTASIATGGAITFSFDHLPLNYAFFDTQQSFPANYAAVFVNNNNGVLTPVLVSTLGVNYVSGQNEIESDYGQPGDYFLSTSNFTETNSFGTFLKTFNQTDSGGYGDTNFIASFDLPAGVTGDYNGNGTVDAGDYVVWRKTPGNFGGSPGGYTTWRSSFGSPPGSGSGLGSSNVPEPTAGVLAGVSMMALLLGKRHFARR
jgi:hypothetical protein